LEVSSSPPRDLATSPPRSIRTSEAVYCTWKNKYADLGVTELRRLETLEDENSPLKRIVADLTLGKQIPAGGRPKNASKAPKRCELEAWMQERFRASVRRSCRLALLRRSRICEQLARTVGRDRRTAR
jgi:hypothetical protein